MVPLEAVQRLGDADVVREVREGNTIAFAVIMRRHNRRLYRAARAIVRDDTEAEDVVQETYLHALAALSSFRGEAAFGTWLIKIAIHEALGRVRRRQRMRALQDIERAYAPCAWASLSTPERHTYEDEVRRALEAAIDALPEGLRVVLVLRALEGMSTSETAETLGLSPMAVKVRLFRARAALKRILRDRADLDGARAFPFEGERCDRMVTAVMLRAR